MTSRRHDLIEELISGKISPLRDEPFASGLQVWRFNGKNICQNNRRLYCLKQYQKGQVDDVMVKIHVTELGSVMEKFTSSHTQVTGQGYRYLQFKRTNEKFSSPRRSSSQL